MKTEKTDKSQIKFKVKKRTTALDPLEFKKIEDIKIVLNKTRAYEFLELDVFPGERPVRERHVQYLFDEMNAGRFLWDNVIIATAKNHEDGKIYRINGQHTCWAVTNLDDSYKEVRLCRYNVNTMADVKELYSVFDRNAPRTKSHIGKVMMMDTPATRDIPPSMISCILAGFRLHLIGDELKNNQQRSTITPEEISVIINESYPDLFNNIGHFVRIHWEDGTFVKRSSVVGAMFATFGAAPQKALEFWTPVCDGVGLQSKTDARWGIRQYLLKTSLSKGGMRSNSVSAEEMYRTVINTWNHWRRGKEVHTIRTTDQRLKAI